MDAKDVIRKAKFHITHMQKFGVNKYGTCVYRRRGRPACLIGKIYADNFKSRPRINGSAELMCNLGIIACSGFTDNAAPFEFLKRLQRIHDRTSRKGDPFRRVTEEDRRDMLDKLHTLASDYGLADALD